jgi:RNA polymerase sigma-32 factor
MRAVFLERVRDFAAGLEPRERRILDARILAEEPRTLQELGAEFGVTRERVRQLEARLVARLAEHLKQHMIDFEFYSPARDD